MKYIKKLLLWSLPATLLFITGCLIVSGTFVVAICEDSTGFSTRTSHYYYFVDLTEEDIWQDHKDDIDRVKMAGFELTITNDDAGGGANTFDVYIAPASVDSVSNTNATPADVIASGAVQILKGVPVKAGTGTKTVISYEESFKYITNFETLKKLAKDGQFHYYGFDSNGQNTNFYTIDNLCIIVTLEASA